MIAPRGMVLVAVLGLAGCADGGFFDRLFHPRPVPPPAPPHYTVGASYRVGGVWRYPREQFEYEETGLAAVAGAHERLTADGEVYDATAMTAGHRTLQLPAIARVTDLDTGRQIVVRLNDRGPANPARLIELTPRAAALLGIGAAPAQVRVTVLEAESRQLAAQMTGDAPKLAVTSAPIGGVQAETLAAPTGAAQSSRVRNAPSGPQPVATSAAPVAAPVPLRLPETVLQGPVQPGSLLIDAGSFSQRSAADLLARRIADLGARTTTSYAAPRDRAYQVRIGPLPTTADADAMLERALRAGVTDARIVVE